MQRSEPSDPGTSITAIHRAESHRKAAEMKAGPQTSHGIPFLYHFPSRSEGEVIDPILVSHDIPVRADLCIYIRLKYNGYSQAPTC
jgi:hypothetical protein